VSEPRPELGARRVVGPFTLRHLVAVAGTLVVAAVLLTALTTPIRPGTDSFPSPGSSFYVTGAPTDDLAPGARAPELAGTDSNGGTVPLVDLSGEPVRLEDYHGRVLWINFFATWCPPCQTETPILRDAYDEYRDEGLELLAISVQESSPDDVRRYADTYELEYAIGFDATSAVFKAYRAFGLPTQVFIDRGGIVRAVHRGPLTSAQVEGILAPLLEEG
jgi:peroxiredoxin